MTRPRHLDVDLFPRYVIAVTGKEKGERVMSENSYRTIQTLLRSSQPEELHRGLKLVRQEISRVGSSEARPLFEMVSAIFHIDPLDRPDLMPILDEAVSLVVGFGDWVIPIMIEELAAGHLKAQLAIGNALGRIGADAVEPLVDAYRASEDPVRCTFILYALGHIESPKVIEAAPLALEAARSPDLELRDTATRAIGRFAASIPPAQLPDSMRDAYIEVLRANLADPNPGIRAKAVRSLGKLAQHGHLSADEQAKLKATCELILGIDGNFRWDRAYIVRREAQEAIEYAETEPG
jgi:HEAT repeat protein